MRERYSGIYCIQNKVNKKRYIGLDKYMWDHNRWFGHRCDLRANRHKNAHLQASWNKYGEESFEYFEIERCVSEKMSEREIYYIKKYRTRNEKYGYNLTNGGDGNHGWTPSEETKRKISESHMGEKNPNYGKKLNDKQKASLTRFGKDNNMFGKPKTEEEKSWLRKILSRDGSPVFGKKYDDSASQYFGVSIYHQKQTKKGIEYIYTYWKAQVRVDKKLHLLGYYKEEIDAAKAYDAFIVENNLNNPLNFPEDYN
jgi:group I intron endonuclease